MYMRTPIVSLEIHGSLNELFVQGLSGWSGARARDAGVSIDVCAREVTTPEAVAYRSRN